MRCKYAFLCEAANITENGLVNVVGGEMQNFVYDKLPAKELVDVLMHVEYEFNEKGDHKIKVRVLDSEGKEMSSIIHDVNFPVNRKHLHLALNLPLNFESFGTHNVLIAVDSHQVIALPIDAVSSR
ncbi:DUF6941 family protein [Thermoproteota archaeon]